ncbi:phospho-sugar mutase, partial [Actinotignum schaalii]|nr:phospho-sugar mutase [Actinotignum schaalii]
LTRAASLVPAGAKDLRIVLTSMHGVGGDTCLEALHRAGFEDVHIVKEQHDPDPDFPTVAFPNPEEPGALDLSYELARKV